jgi:hypothetical protein
MSTNRLVVLNPASPEPTFGVAADAAIVDMPSAWVGDGKALRKALDSGLLVLHPVGRAVGKRPTEEKGETESKGESKPTPPKPPKK